jgi:hypothetical protein
MSTIVQFLCVNFSLIASLHHKPSNPYEENYKEDIVAVLHSTIVSLKNLAKHIACKYAKLEGGKIRDCDLSRCARKKIHYIKHTQHYLCCLHLRNNMSFAAADSL